MGQVASSVDNALNESFWSSMQVKLLDRNPGPVRFNSPLRCLTGLRVDIAPNDGTLLSE